MIPIAAWLVRRACRVWLTGPLRVADLVASVRAGDWQLCLIRHRRPDRWTAQEVRDIKRRARHEALEFDKYCA